MFTRKLSPAILAQLRDAPLFAGRLKADCLQGKVFPAIRKDRVEFYYKGNRLFEYDAGLVFRTNAKFALVAAQDPLMITETDLEAGTVPLIRRFDTHYDEIKRLCAAYAMPESMQVAILCGKFSFAKRGKPQRIVVIDTEVGFGGKSYIDLVFYDKKAGRLIFCEVKRRGDKRNWQPSSPTAAEPEVVEQIRRYQAEISKNRDAVADSYENYIKSMWELLGLDQNELPLPPSGRKLLVEDDIPLLLVGYDSRQRDAAMRLKRGLEAKDVTVHAIGSTGSVSAETLSRKWFPAGS